MVKNKSKSGKATKKRSQAVLLGKGDYTAVDRKTLESVQASLNKLDKKIPELSGASVGRTIGKFFGRPELGEKAGSTLASIFGMGDYEIKSNSLVKIAGNMSASTVPSFTKEGRAIRIREREFVCDVVSGSLVGAATKFSSQSFRLNPANQLLFPWLSAIAPLFDQWEPHGIVLEFVPTSSAYNGTSQALGTVIMATDYDPLDSLYVNKLEMENSDYANSVKPDTAAMHGIECDPGERPTKLFYTGSTTNGNPQLFDLGNFQIATAGMSAAGVVLGELWVSYDISLYKKQLTGGFGSQTIAGVWTSAAASTTTSYAGTATAASWNSPNLSVVQILGNSTKFVLPPSQFAGRYLVSYSAATVSGNPIYTDLVSALVNCTKVSEIGSGTVPNGTVYNYSAVIEITGPNATFSTQLANGSFNFTRFSISMVPSSYTQS